MMTIFKKSTSSVSKIDTKTKEKLVCWFEIPVRDISRACSFYSNLFNLNYEFITLRDRMHAIIKPKQNSDFNISGALVDFSNEDFKKGTKLYFYCPTGISDYLKKTIDAGGKIILPKTLITNPIAHGKSIIPKTLIDNNLGYFAFIEDTEGNEIGLYSNS